MISITKQGDTTTYGVNEYVVDTDQEINDIQNAKVGSTAYSIESGNEYLKTQSGAWTIKGVGTGGTSEPIDLPDNLLYSYEMTEEEFWDSYSNGTLNDGLYAYSIGVGLLSQLTQLETEIDFVSYSPLILNERAWIVSQYSNPFSLIEINSKGDIISNININSILSESIEFQFNYYSEAGIGIDNTGCIYISNFDKTLMINTNKKTNSIINNKQNTMWLFRNQSYLSKSNYDFRIKDGGTFGIQIETLPGQDQKSWCNAVGYFKNGEQQFELNKSNSLMVVDYDKYQVWTDFCTVDYENNKFYMIDVSRTDVEYQCTININCYDIFGNQKTYVSEPIKTFANFSQENYGQVFIKNNILYGHIILNSEDMFCFLFDLTTETFIQIETIDIGTSGYQAKISRTSNNIYFYDNYAILLLDIYQYSLTPKSYCIKTTYEDTFVYLSIDKLDDYGMLAQSFNSNNCYDNKTILINTDDKLINIINLEDYSSTPINFWPLESNISYGQMKEEELLIVAYSYEGTQINCVKIDLNSGNVISNQQYINTTNNPNLSNTLYCFPDINQFIYNQIVFEYDHKKKPYQINTILPSNFIAKLGNNSLYGCNQTIGYYGTGELNISNLIHKNNIILTKTIGV